MIKIHNIDEVYVWVECDQGIAWELRDHFTFKVPGAHFMPSYRRGGWDGEIRLFDVRTNRIYRGLVPRIEKFCGERDYEFSYDYFNNEFSIKEAWDFIETLGLPFKPRDYQVDAFVHAIREKRLLLLSPTASGKSLIIYLITRYFNTKTLIVVPTISLVDQMTGDFADYGLDTEKNVHKIYSGQDKISDKQIYISTWQSIFSLKKGFFDQFQTVIGDECLSPDTPIMMSDGSMKHISKIRPGDMVITLNEKTNKKENMPVNEVFKNISSSEQTFRITLDDGRKIDITGNHKVMKKTGVWEKVENLKEGDSLNTFEGV